MEERIKPVKQPHRIRAFLAKKGICISAKVYFVDAMGAMAYGLFATLLIGTIFGTIGEKLNVPLLIQIADYCKAATGPALGLAIAYKLGAPMLVLLSAAAVGFAGNALGGPVGAFLAAIIGTEFGKLVSKETRVDIIVTPAVTILTGAMIAIFVGPGVSALMNGLGLIIMRATELQPVLMGIIVSVIVGMVLTLPISSAALCIMLGLSGIAAGAATAGCCAQMVGFAVMSFRENRWGGLLAQGLGTSMLQMGNIVKNPRIWLPPTLAAAITGPIASAVFKLESIPAAAGMGTCGLVGPIGIFTAMEPSVQMWLGILLVCFVLPAILSWLFYLGLRRIGWIKDGDLTLTQE
ncbi:MAG: PTS sugar transporter subunit IIC [Clostridia bacterium]